MKRIYVDMDDTLCAFKKAFKAQVHLATYPQSRYGFFLNLEPLPDAIDSYKELEKDFDVWILTRPSVHNPLCYTEKRLWVENHLGFDTCKKLIISPDKSLLKGDFLIDDYPHLGFEGEQIFFGSESFPDWKSVLKYLKEKT